MNTPEQTPVGAERREFHRIRYPIPERPSLFLEANKAYTILDVSGRGLRYASGEPFVRRLYDPVRGLLQFRRGTKIAIQGTIVRADEREIALYLHQEIPFNILLAEQQYLRKHYSMWS